MHRMKLCICWCYRSFMVKLLLLCHEIQIPGTNELMARVTVFFNHSFFLRTVLFFLRCIRTVPTCRINAVCYLSPPLTILLPRYVKQLLWKFRYLPNTCFQSYKTATFLLTTVKITEYLYSFVNVNLVKFCLIN